ncbi:hypothetical protein [Rhizobium skierniewicense]|uniref:hypothetical protein n=1 Tax=Rhizobium/Agrobacterium group TaxID=227290 RepID=UPI00157234F4|nr:hypothetical protein [Rhizobium skierniewicense]NTF34129.1 hypothetical protein [Rhizobium skierniewicense]
MNTLTSLEAWLIDRGLTAQEAAVWSDFVIDALELVDEAYALLLTPAEWASFIAGCHALPTEPDLTSGLGDRMKRLWVDASFDSRRDRVIVAYEVPTPGDEKHGKHKSKADFRFERKFEAGYCAAFVVEAKSLRTKTDLTSRYLGSDGIGCFTHRAPPYSTAVMAGMLGYAMSNPSTWEPDLSTALKTFPETRRYRSISIGLAGKQSLASDHPRTQAGSDSDVTILHSILDFDFAQHMETR